jgi:acyl-CoA synthetase (AMP-forming)/AMP-acid ligase II
LFHVNAIMVNVVALAVGGSTYIAERFDLDGFWGLVEQHRPTFFSAVPAIYYFLTLLPEDVEPDVSSLRFAICGAAPMPAEAITAFEGRYGIPIIEGYGLSETTVALTFNTIEDRRPGTVGRPLDGVEVRVVDDAGTALPAGRDGEVIAWGPNIMRGYLNQPAATAAALDGGWLHTGDVGHFDDDGYLVLVDRMKDLIIRGGENISPSEVEAVLQAHPAVAQAAVVGRPDPVMGEEPMAFVVPTPGAEIDTDALRAHCRRVLGRFKVPRAIYEVDDLPRNAVGKVTKHVLRERLASTPTTP